MCLTASVGRRHFDNRAALVFRERAQLAGLLEQVAAGSDAPSVARGIVSRSRPAPKIGFLFTGQGSQYPGMGRALYAQEPVFREALDSCAAIFDRLLAQPLLPLLFSEPGTPEAELLNQTGYTQPALFSFEYALAMMWRAWGIHPDVVMGHSVGEITAMCVAEGISLADGLTLIAARGRLMQALPPGGGMTSIMATEERVREAIAGFDDRVSIAAINGPRQIVIAGDLEMLAGISATLGAEGIKTRALTVSHAFHSPLMRPMLADYAAVVNSITLSTPTIPFVSCVDGRLAGAEVNTPEYWLRNVTDPVRFAAGVTAMTGEGVTALLEIGPQPVLLGMARETIGEGADDLQWLPSLRKDGDPATPLLGLGRLYASGAEIEWRSVQRGRRTSLPSYPFERKRFWIGAPRVRPAVPPSTVSRAAADDVRGPQHQLYTIAWSSQDRPAVPARAPAGHWAVFTDDAGVGQAAVARLRALGSACSVVMPGDRFEMEGPDRYRLDRSEPGDFERLFDALEPSAGTLAGVLFLWPLRSVPAEAADDDGVVASARVELLGLVYATQAFARRRAAESSARIWVATRGAVDIAGGASESTSLSASPLWGFARTAALEAPETWGGIVDLAPGEAAELSAHRLVDEILSNGVEDQLALRTGVRLVPRLVTVPAVPSPAPALDANGTYLVTGGLGALGARAARWLVDRGARHLVLTSRSGMSASAAETIVRELEERGATVTVVAADISRQAEVARLIAGIGQLRGIVHAAGTDTPSPLAELRAATITDVFAAKASGAWWLHEATRHMPLDLFVMFSSVAGILGAQGRAHYGAANSFLDALATQRRREGLAALSVCWGPWKGGGMANAASLQQFERVGNHGLDPDDAVRGMDEAIRAGEPVVSVADISWATFLPIYEARRPRPMVSTLAELENPVASAAIPQAPASGDDLDRHLTRGSARRAPAYPPARSSRDPRLRRPGRRTRRQESLRQRHGLADGGRVRRASPGAPRHPARRARLRASGPGLARRTAASRPSAGRARPRLNAGQCHELRRGNAGPSSVRKSGRPSLRYQPVRAWRRSRDRGLLPRGVAATACGAPRPALEMDVRGLGAAPRRHAGRLALSRSRSRRWPQRSCPGADRSWLRGARHGVDRGNDGASRPTGARPSGRG